MYINKDSIRSLQTDNNNNNNSTNLLPESPETPSWGPPSNNNNDAGWAPISPETPSWGPPSNNDNDAGWAPISPETPSWGPPSNNNNNAGWAPISPETPSWGPPSNNDNNAGWAPISPETPSWRPPSSGGSSIIPPVIVIPGIGQTNKKLSNIRFLYAATGQTPVNIRLGGRTVINHMQFGNSTPYYLDNAGYQTIQVINANTGSLLYQSIFYFSDGTAYTLALVDNSSRISVMQLVDTPCSSQNTACVRAVNLSPNSGPVDIFLSGIGRIFQNVDTFGVTDYHTVQQGAYRAFVSEALSCSNNSSIIMTDSYVECNNTRIAIMGSSNINFMSGVSYSLYVIGRAYQLPAVQLLSLESDLIY